MSGAEAGVRAEEDGLSLYMRIAGDDGGDVEGGHFCNRVFSRVSRAVVVVVLVVVR